VDDQQPNALGVYGTQSFVLYYISNVSVDLVGFQYIYGADELIVRTRVACSQQVGLL
jgi:hypothetical protein